MYLPSIGHGGDDDDDADDGNFSREGITPGQTNFCGVVYCLSER